MGEEDDTVGGVADRRGPAGSGCERGGRGRGHGRRAGLLVGRSHGRVSWPARVAWAGLRAEQAVSACKAFFFPF